ncbi:Lrp/AsnC family transcriptional regulator [Nanoarchaeota archaeon]
MTGFSLDAKDVAILDQLERNSRLSATQIAKKLKLSKAGVNYRIKNLVNNKIITRFFIDIDVAKLGLTLNKVAFQFQNTTKEKEAEIFRFLKGHPKIGWVVFCSGRWDAIIVAYVRSIHEYENLVKEINEKFGAYIHSKEFIAHPKYYVCSRKWLIPGSQVKVSNIGGPEEIQTIDSIDIEIIKLLAKNARVPVLEMANKLGISSSLVIQRMRNLEKKGIILNYRVGLNLEKIGKEFCKSFIYLQNPTKESEQKLVNYCLQHPNVTAVTHALGAWDIELEMEVENFDQFYKIMNEIKNKFNNIIKNYEAIVITKQYGIDYSTMLD